ncbi:MAG: iron uptake porin, partial [Cyanobacteriota bacterium]|nr:iron uptake porin [Cyanobacteriota bacterium]
MKPFHRLLLAPVVLGVVAPLASQAQSLDMGTVNRYVDQQDVDRMRALEAQMGQVTSVSQFSDVQPTDWAYQALSNLVTKYGCVAGYPNGTFKGKQAMTRYEAAALLNACLDRVTEMTEELKRLLKEFEKEMAVLKAKVDGLEAKTEELAATQFSTTTKLKGQSVFWLGGTKYNGRNKGESPLANTGNGLDNVTSYSDALAANANAALAGGQFRNG